MPEREDVRRLARARRHVAPLPFTRPLSTPLGPRPLATLLLSSSQLTLLTGASFPAEDTLHVYPAYFGLLQ